jgi:sulfide:quinone oxidoreductase
VGHSQRPKSYDGLHVLVAGGGVAGLETLLALRDMAGDLVDLELLAPEPEFWYRPLAVVEPFGGGRAHQFELAAIADSLAAGFTLDQLASIDPDAHLARTRQGAEVGYDVLVVACGTIPRATLADALTFRGPADSDGFRRLLDEAESGSVGSIAFVAPAAGVWPLPLYELALMTATHLEQRGKEVDLALVTSEPAPLSLFGEAASDVVRELLDERGISLHTGCAATRPEAGKLELVPGGSLVAERVVSLPRLEGLRILGIPQDDDGFIATDPSGLVIGLADVYAAGDITRFPIKQGGIAAQQADAVAEAIAARAGAALEPQPFRPVLRGQLLTGRGSRYLHGGPLEGSDDTGPAGDELLWWPTAKIAGRYLAPFLARHGGPTIEPPAGRIGALDVDVALAAQVTS